MPKDYLTRQDTYQRKEWMRNSTINRDIRNLCKKLKLKSKNHKNILMLNLFIFCCIDYQKWMEDREDCHLLIVRICQIITLEVRVLDKISKLRSLMIKALSNNKSQ